MKQQFTKSLGIALLLFFSIVSVNAAIYYSKGNVDPTVLANWNSDRDGTSGTFPADFVSGDVFVIQNSNSMTTAATWIVSGTAAEIQIESGGTLTIANAVTTQQLTILSGGLVILNSAIVLTINDGNASGADLQVSGILKSAGTVTYGTGASGLFASGGKYQHNYINAGAVPTATWATGSTCEFIGQLTGTNTPTNIGQSFYNIIWNCTSQSAAVNLSGGLTTVNGDLTVQSTGTGEVRLSGSAALTLNIAGNVNINAGTLRFGAGTGKNRTSIGGNINVAGGTVDQTNNSSCNIKISVAGNVNVTTGLYSMNSSGNTTDTLSVAGDISLSGGTFSPSGNTSSSVTVYVSGNLSLSGSAAFSPSAQGSYTMNISKDLSISGASTYTAGYSSSSGSKTYTVNLGRNFSMTGGSLVYSATAATTNGVFNFTGGTPSVTFTQSGGTFTPSGTVSGINWMIDNGKIVTFNSVFVLPSTTTKRTFTISAGGKLTTAATFTNNGITTINGSFQLDEGGWATGTDFVYGAAGTLIFNNSAGFYGVGSPAYWPAVSGPVHVTVQNTGGIELQVPRTVTGLFQTAAGVKNTYGNDLTVSGTVKLNAGGYFGNFSPTYTSTGTLVYNTGGPYGVFNEWGAGSTVGYGVPQNVTVANATAVTLAGARTIPGTLTLTSGTVSLGANDLTMGATGSISGASATNYIVTDGAGRLIQTIGAGSTAVFPIGASTSSYDPATITPTSATDVAVNVGTTLPATAPANYTYNAKVWDITPVTPSSTSITLTPSAAIATAVSDVVGHYVGSTYVNVAAAKSGNAYTATFDTFSPFVTGTTDLGTAVAQTNMDGVSFDGQVIHNDTNSDIQVFNITGKMLFHSTKNISMSNNPTGIYFVKSNNGTLKIAVTK